MGVGSRAITSWPFFARRRNTLLNPPSASLVISGQDSCCTASLATRWSSVGRNSTYRSFKRSVSLNLAGCKQWSQSPPYISLTSIAAMCCERIPRNQLVVGDSDGVIETWQDVWTRPTLGGHWERAKG
jgi:hypothetical protein